MARWCGNDRGPDKLVEGAYLHVKGEITAIAFSKKGKFQCPDVQRKYQQLQFWKCRPCMNILGRVQR